MGEVEPPNPLLRIQLGLLSSGTDYVVFCLSIIWLFFYYSLILAYQPSKNIICNRIFIYSALPKYCTTIHNQKSQKNPWLPLLKPRKLSPPEDHVRMVMDTYLANPRKPYSLNRCISLEQMRGRGLWVWKFKQAHCIPFDLSQLKYCRFWRLLCTLFIHYSRDTMYILQKGLYLRCTHSILITILLTPPSHYTLHSKRAANSGRSGQDYSAHLTRAVQKITKKRARPCLDWISHNIM